MNELHFGDNLDVLRAMPSQSVDLIYLDPPFNSNANYNVLYGTKGGGASKAQSHAFEDTWNWGLDAQRALNETAERHLEAGALLDAFQKVFAGSTMMAYLSMMAVRLIEMQRILKSTGALYLHCDPTASHYLKIFLDAIFGVNNFRSEVIWKRSSAHSSSKRYSPVHDTIHFYSKSEKFTWNPAFQPIPQETIDAWYNNIEPGTGRRFNRADLTAAGQRNGSSGLPWRGIDPTSKGRHWAIPGYVGLAAIPAQEALEILDQQGRLYWPKKANGMPMFKRYLDESPGIPALDVITDIAPLNNVAKERLGYPTQKPLALLERIIAASSNPGDIVLDPFCGCGTAIEASEKLGRKWIGIDITYLAIHVIEERLQKTFGPKIKDAYTLYGRPEDAEDAKALAARDWLEFQKWAVFTLGGLPKDRPGADGGIDGVIRYHRIGMERASRAIVSVKGGLNVGVDTIHKLKSVVKREEAEIGILVCVNPPTGPMLREAASEGEFGPPTKRVPKIQIVTVEQLFWPVPVHLPGMLDPPEAISVPAPGPGKRGRKRIEGQTEMLFPIEGKPRAEDKGKAKGNRSIRPVAIEVTRADRRKAK